MDPSDTAVAGAPLGLTLGEDVQRQRLRQEQDFDDLASHYSALSEDLSLDPKLREAALLLSVAEEQLQGEDADEALKSASDALEQFRGHGHQVGVQDSLRLVCGANCFKGMADKALEEAHAELNRYKEAGNKRGQASMHMAVARVLQWQGNSKEALDALADALELCRSIGDKQLEGDALLDCVSAHISRDFSGEAVRDADAARSLYIEGQDKKGQIKAGMVLALAHVENHSLDDAVKVIKEALAVAQALKDAKLEASVLCTFAKIQLLKERPRAAGKAAEDALAICRNENRSRQEGSALESVVQALLERGNASKATMVAEESLARFLANGNKRCQAVAHRAMSKAHAAKNKVEEAVSEAEQEMALLKELGDTRGRASSLLGLSELHAQGENGTEALMAAEEAAKLMAELKDRRGEASALYAQVVPHIINEDYDDALEKADQARDIYQDIGDRRGDGRALWAICHALMKQEDYSTAIAKAQEAQVIFEEVGDKRGVANSLLVLSESQTAAGDHEEALKSAKQASEICQSIGHRKGQANALQRQVQGLIAHGHSEEALKVAAQARTLFCGVEDKFSEVSLLHIMAKCSLDEGTRKASKPGNASKWRAVRKHGRQANKCSRAALGIASMLENDYSKGTSMLYAAQGHILNARLTDALNISTKAERIFREKGDKVQEARAAVLQAQVHAFDELMSEFSIEAANRALELAREAKDAEAEDAAISILEEIYTREAAKEAAKARPQQQADMLQDRDVGAAEEITSAAAPEKQGLDVDMVRPKVFETVKNVTGADEEVMMDTPLMDTGMDSLSAVAFRNELNRMFTGINLPASLMFDYPNINQITDHIVEQSKA